MVINMVKMYRHGDLLIKKVEKLDENLEVVENVLAYGEVTGHSHKIAGATVYQNKNGNRFITVQEIASLTHEEHKEIQLEKGTYAVIRQREYTPEGLRAVVD